MPVYFSSLDGIIECVRMGARHGRKKRMRRFRKTKIKFDERLDA